jgi:SAM-dependent methyltransferase
MPTQQELWKQVHDRYATQAWIDQPTLFAKWVIQYFSEHGRILELGAGLGQDSRYFAELDYSVVSTDFSAEALAHSKAKLTGDLQQRITLQQLDLLQPLPFPDASFEVVYSHLALHYFDDPTTDRIFGDIHRVLKQNGVVAALFNSVDDPEYKEGERFSNGLVQVPNGLIKRFFSSETLRERVSLFTPLILDNKGESHKDKEEGVANLIRFVGKKI